MGEIGGKLGGNYFFYFLDKKKPCTAAQGKKTLAFFNQPNKTISKVR